MGGIKKWIDEHPTLWEFILFNILSNVATVTNFVVMWVCTGFIFKSFSGQPFQFFSSCPLLIGPTPKNATAITSGGNTPLPYQKEYPSCYFGAFQLFPKTAPKVRNFLTVFNQRHREKPGWFSKLPPAVQFLSACNN